MTATIISAAAIVAAIIWRFIEYRRTRSIEDFEERKRDRYSGNNGRVPTMRNPPPPPPKRTVSEYTTEIRGFAPPQRPPSKPDKH